MPDTVPQIDGLHATPHCCSNSHKQTFNRVRKAVHHTFQNVCIILFHHSAGKELTNVKNWCPNYNIKGYKQKIYVACLIFSATKQDQERFDTWKSKYQSLCGPLIFRFAIHFCFHMSSGMVCVSVDLLNFKSYSCFTSYRVIHLANVTLLIGDQWAWIKPTMASLVRYKTTPYKSSIFCGFQW